MKSTICFAAFAVAMLSSVTPARAALVISEVLYNEVGSDVGGEWIEIYNSGPVAVDLSNYKVGDEETSGSTSTTEGMFQFPAGAIIGAGVAQVIAVSADVFQTNYGFLPTYEVTGANGSVPNLTLYAMWDPDGTTINMSNSNDQAVLLDGADSVVDAVSWGNTFAFDPGLDPNAEADGQSYERNNALVDTNMAADWRLGNPSSPGTAPIPEPAGLNLAASAAAMIAGMRRPRGKPASTTLTKRIG